MPTIHWLGAGLSSGPGIRRLAERYRDLTLWNRTLSKAEDLLEGIESASTKVKQLTWDKLTKEVSPGDVLVSMLPATLHLRVAGVCLDKKAHFVSTSYVSPEMRSLSKRAESDKLCFVNESGLDPGIDHLMAHSLMSDYRSSDQFDRSNEHYFRSYCGGLSKEKNDFRYKFSWSPLGVLRALVSQAQWIEDGDVRSANRPWQALRHQEVTLPTGATESFEAYPNRDSIPYMREYGFEEDWNVQQFVRGTLRYDGWSAAWNDIFQLVDATDGDEREEAFAAKSKELWQQHRFAEGEADRVTLAVDLEVRRDDKPIWHQVYGLDEIGDQRDSAMARLVSLPASIAVEAVVDGKIQPGVSGAPSDKPTVDAWLSQLSQLGVRAEKLVLV